MRFILDTDTISLYRRGHLAVGSRINTTEASQIAVTIISFDEQISGRLAQTHRAHSPSEAKARSHRRQIRLGDSALNEHFIIFAKGKMIDIICPLREQKS